MARISKRIQNKHQEDLDRWLVSYADYMTLMFALFVVLYAMAVVKEQSFDVLSESLGEIFQITGESGTGTTGDGVLTQQVSQADQLEGNSLKLEKGPELVDNDIVLNESLDKKLGNPLNELKFELKTALHDLTENGVAKLEQDDDWLTIELSSGLLFASGSATANPSASIVIEEIAKVLNRVNNFIEVRGYTDSLAINNEIFSSNWQLSAARAAAITFMLEQFGVLKQRLGIEANGSNNPIAGNDTAVGRAQNRRVVIALSKFAYQVGIDEEQQKSAIKDQISDNIPNRLPEYDDIKIIKLPNGGIRITTRREAGDNVQQETNKDEDIDGN